MDVREKLVELIVEASHECDDFYDLWDMREVADGIADFLIANGVTVQEWISVKDRLPEDICPVLVALEGLNIAFYGFYQYEKWWKVGAGTRPFIQKVTHWMLLPKPPKGE